MFLGPSDPGGFFFMLYVLSQELKVHIRPSLFSNPKQEKALSASSFRLHQKKRGHLATAVGVLMMLSADLSQPTLFMLRVFGGKLDAKRGLYGLLTGRIDLTRAESLC